MNRLRNRLIAAFLASTLLPLAATVAITTTLLDRTCAMRRPARSIGCRALRRPRGSSIARTGGAEGRRARRPRQRDDVRVRRCGDWPPTIRAFWESGEPERFGISGTGGDRLEYLRRTDAPGVVMYTRDLGGVKMADLSAQLGETRRLVEEFDARDLRRGFTLTLLALLGAAWLISLAPLVIIANRVSRPVRQLTAALTDFAAGDWSRRLESGRRAGEARDEVGQAVDAFNRMADQLEEHRDRLVHLTRLAS
jgi:HAMP domain-containing protein